MKPMDIYTDIELNETGYRERYDYQWDDTWNRFVPAPITDKDPVSAPAVPIDGEDWL